MSAAAGTVGLRQWVGRPAFWWILIALLAGGPFVSGLLRRPPPPLPVLDQLPSTGRGRLVVFADPRCPECIAASSEKLRALGRHLRWVRTGFDLEWNVLGDLPGFSASPEVIVSDSNQAGSLARLLARSPQQAALRRGERAVLVDALGRVRAFPLLASDPQAELLPAITQVVNGR